jgi:6-pyruvoyltetrahydropterin/6-carboxytetrahydropterin synthase
LNNTGFVIDFWDLDPIVKKFIDQVDHRCLNDIGGLENPTAENIARWFYDRIFINVPLPLQIECVRVYETDECFAEYRA